MDWLRSRFELSRSGDAPHSRPMEGLRGYAVLLVFLVHYVTLASPWIARPSLLAGVADAMRIVGNTGVDLFFVLSGYLIYGSLIGRRQEFLPYFRRRVGRIYPAFSVVFCLYLALSLAFPRESRIPAAPLQGVLYLAENFLLLAGFGHQLPMVTVSWSLSYEMAYYLAIPLLIAAFKLRRRSARWRIGFFSALLMLAGAGSVAAGTPVRTIMFLAGVLLHEAMAGQRPGVWTPPARAVVPALVAAMTLMLLPFPWPALSPLIRFGGLSAAFFLFCLACFQQPAGPVGGVCSVAAVRWLGNMSYSYYLLHGLALKAAFAVVARAMPPAVALPDGGWLFFIGMLAPMLAWTLLPSAALFLLVERPYSLAPTPTSRQKAALQRP